MDRIFFLVIQVLGAASAVAGLWALLGLSWTLLIAGLVLLVGGTAAEVIALRPLSAPPAGRSGPLAVGVE